MPDPIPRQHLPAFVPFEDREVVQIVASAEEANRLQGYLRSRDCYLYEIPATGDDLPTYGIGLSDRALAAAERESRAAS